MIKKIGVVLSGKKTYNEKLQGSKDMHKIEEITDPKQILRYGGTKLLIAPPLIYDKVMRTVPKKKVITLDYLRAYLAKSMVQIVHVL